MPAWSSPVANGTDGGAAGPGADDPLAAFLDGMHGLSSHDAPVGPLAAVSAAVVLLSNGLNADGGVAQLVSALASVHDGNAAFNATPFTASSDPGLDGAIAPSQ